MTETFATLIIPVIQSVIDFQDGLRRGVHPTLEAERGDLLRFLDESERKSGRSSPELARDFQLAKYALVYWIDEVLINSRWRHASEWQNEILEYHFYREGAAAIRFYEKAAEAEKRASTDPLETFFLCFALGFRGDLASSESRLVQWADRIHRRIAEATKHAEHYVPPTPGMPVERELRPLDAQHRLLVVSLLVAVTAFVTLIGFITAVHLR